MDFVFVLLGILFFACCLALTGACESLRRPR
jgi:hypothetical protein